MNERITSDPVLLFRALSEEVRLRVLCVLDVAEMSVVELTEALDVPQSTISRHLARLREADLVSTRRQGTLVFYSKDAAQNNGLNDLVDRAVRALSTSEPDRAAANRILDRRRRMSQKYFDAMARRYSEMVEPGGSWRALAGALALGYDGKVVADVGAGEGELSLRLAQSAEKVYAIDQSREMVKLLKEKARGIRNLVVQRGDLEALPLGDASCDVAIVSQVLHHCPRPRVALAETFRALRPGGRLILLDLEEHEHEWTREKLADHWLGFNVAELTRWVAEAGFLAVVSHKDPTSYDGLIAITVTGRKPGASLASGRSRKSGYTRVEKGTSPKGMNVNSRGWSLRNPR